MKLDTKYTKTVLAVCLPNSLAVSTVCGISNTIRPSIRLGGPEAAAGRRGRHRPAAGIQRDRLLDGGPAPRQNIRHERHESVRIARRRRAARRRQRQSQQQRRSIGGHVRPGHVATYGHCASHPHIRI